MMTFFISHLFSPLRGEPETPICCVIKDLKQFTDFALKCPVPLDDASIFKN